MANNQIKTPDLTALSLSTDFQLNVYEPAEDSFLMLDALEKDLELIRENNPLICVEVGCGCGVLSAGLASVLKNCAFFATDINCQACLASQCTSELNKVIINVVKGNLMNNFESRLQGNVDILLCNPPYVKTEEKDTESADITASWAGGKLGRNVTDRVIQILPKVLSTKGVAYIVLEQCNEPDKVIQFAETQGLDCEKVLERRAGREVLSVIKFSGQKKT